MKVWKTNISFKLALILSIVCISVVFSCNSYASSYEEAVSYWKFDDKSADDDFSSGSVDYDRWLDYYASPAVTSGQLRVVDTPQDLSAGLKTNTENVTKFTGYFDVQVDFDASSTSKPSQGFTCAELRIQGSTYYYGVQNHYYSDGSHAYASWTSEDGGRAWGSSGTTQDSGKFRIKRDSSGLHGYSWTGSAWSEFASDTTPDSSDMYVSILGTYGFSGCDVDAIATFDNFQVVNGEQVIDSNGTNTGVISGATQVAGQSGNALSFSSAADTVTVTDNSSLDVSSAVTVCAWVNPQGDSPDWSKIAIKPSDDNYYLYTLSLNNGSGGAEKVTFSTGDGLGNYSDTWSTSNLNIGEWNFLVGTFDNGTQKIYINGILENTTVGAYSLLGTSSKDFLIGNDPVNGQYFNGLIDDVGIWDRALDAYEIGAIYDMGIEKFESLSAIVNNDWGLDMTTEEISQLAQLYADGKDGLDPEAVVAGDKSWTYLSGELPGDFGGTTYEIGDSWIYEGKYYIKLGSGLEGGAVPELPPFAAQGMTLVFGGVVAWVRRRRTV